MKKLMIAMGAAAMMSLCAQAIPQGGTSLETGTTFENYVGDFDISADDYGGDQYARYWAQRAEGVTGDSALVTENANTFLKVDETEELTRLIDVDQGAVTPKTVVGQGGSSIYFSSKVQFTAADDAPVPAAGIDKIIVWAKAPEDGAPEGTTTNLMVTALDLDEQSETYGQPRAYDTLVPITADEWYTLEIVAAAQSGDSPIAFTVTLKGTAVGTYNVGTYNSMVTSGTAGAGTISSASFKGTGAVDDIDWGTVTAAVVDKFTLNATITDVYDEQQGEFPGLSSATWQIDSATPDPFVSPLNEQVPVTATKVTFALTVYADSEVTNEGAVKGELVTVEGDDCYVWTLEVDVSGSTAETVKNVAITIQKTGSQPPQPEEPSITPSAGDTSVNIPASETINSKAAAENAAIAAIKAPAGVEDASTYRSYFKATAADPVNGVYTVTVELDPNEVTPEIDADNVGLDIAGGKIAVETKPGLFYQLLRGTVPTTIETTVAEVQADDAAEVLTDANPPADKAFYKVSVTAAATQN